jgi:hypothetical protein
LDIEGADTPFAANLATACAAFHVRRSQYIVCVPASPSGQFLLCVQADMPLRQGFAFQKWTHALPDSIDGMGYDHASGEVVYTTTPVGGATGWKAASGTYHDGTGTGTAYDFGLDAWYARGERQYVLANPLIYVTAYRSAVGTDQTITMTCRGSPTADASGGTSSGSLTLTLAADTRPIVGGVVGVSGEALQVTLRTTDKLHLALLALSIDGPVRRGA